MCVGKRFADLETQMLIVKLLQRFDIGWEGTAEEELPYEMRLVVYPKVEMKFRFKELKRHSF